ncbi:hypothetical protein [Methylomagnum ishizawai]|uniref:hypothetical protein n=1 Tax=Methylomagnum ishizawai TaxID=1760988 RepID=UPI001C335C0C|nr:hypothetical protein [Methylomagnum ishizawai]BBL75953.1 hypothetical protein MishRS11D_30510 [Methylomagnum ishizawai]
MDIRKTAFYPVAVPPAPMRTRSEAVGALDPQAARNSENPAPSTSQERFRPVDPASRPAEGRTRYRTEDATDRVERQAALNAKAQQALRAYLSHEQFAQQESRTALNQTLGVDYYA